MSISKSTLRSIVLVVAMAPLLEGCIAAVGAGAATGAEVAYDRRTAGTFVDDQIIELKALEAFHNDKQLWEQSHINAVSFNNVVLLTGEIPSEQLRVRAVELVRNIPKVRQVHDEITIAAPSSMLSRSGDTWITGKVKTALISAESIQAERVKVVTEKGVVYLMGLLTHAEANRATDIARRVSGVQRVVKLMEYTD